MRAIDRGVLGLAVLIDPDTEQFTGLVTDGDLRRALLNGLGLEAHVTDIPRTKPITATLNNSAEELVKIISQYKSVRCVPILDDGGKVVDLAILDRRVRIPVAEPLIGEKELEYVSECVLTGWISSAGKFVNEFEEAFAEYCGTKHTIATSNGTAALHLTMLALNIGPGDEVIVPSLTFIATANAVTYTGAKPIFVNSQKETWNISPDGILAAITPKTKAIIPVHLYGHPAEMDTILDIASTYGIAVVEDAAEAHGALYKGKKVGSLGDMGTFSFYGNKIITTGEGGMVVTNRDDLADNICVLRDHGMSRDQKYWHPVVGYNYRLTNLQAAIGVAQMEKIEHILNSKLRIANAYSEALADIPGIILPPNASWARSVYWLYSILVDKRITGIGRDSMISQLAEKGFDSRPLFPPVHTQPIYDTGQKLAVAEYLSKVGLSLPSAVNLDLSDVNKLADTIRSLVLG